MLFRRASHTYCTFHRGFRNAGPAGPKQLPSLLFTHGNAQLVRRSAPFCSLVPIAPSPRLCSRIRSRIQDIHQSEEKEGNENTTIFRDQNGKTALHWAAQKNHRHVVSWLVQSGGYTSLDDILQIDKFGRNCFHWAVLGNAMDVIEWLLRHVPEPQAALQVKTQSGKTAVELAMDLELEDLCSYLQRGDWGEAAQLESPDTGGAAATRDSNAQTQLGDRAAGGDDGSRHTGSVDVSPASGQTTPGQTAQTVDLPAEDEVSRWLEEVDVRVSQYAPKFHEVRHHIFTYSCTAHGKNSSRRARRSQSLSGVVCMHVHRRWLLQ